MKAKYSVKKFAPLDDEWYDYIVGGRRFSNKNIGYRFVLSIGKKKIGSLDLILTYQGIYETHSQIIKEFRGKGYGIKLYSIAINYALRKKWRVGSSKYASNLAINVWESKRLRKQFKIVRICNRYRVKHKC